MAEATRQLAAIMFTDIVGYTKLMGEDEKLAIQTLEKSTSIQTAIIEKYNGKVLKEIGDGLLVSFNSAVDAVNSAIEIQKYVEKEEHINLRIGIHLGDVIFKDGDVLGDGVNVASRVESIGTPGSVLISEKVKSELVNKEIDLVYLGSFNLKNIDQQVPLYAVQDEGLTIPNKQQLKTKKASVAKKRLTIFTISIILFISLWYFINNNLLVEPKEDNSLIKIAVVPFNTSDHDDIEYLGEGMMDILSSKFSRLPGLTVLDPQISKSLYNKANADVINFIKLPFLLDKNYQFIVSGSVIKLGSITKFIGKIIEEDGNEVGSIELDCTNTEEVFNCIDEFSRLIISELQKEIRLDFSNQAPFSTNNWDAFKEFMAAEKARRLGEVSIAHGHYEQAIHIDSTFALAWLRGYTNAAYYFSDVFPIENVNIYSNKLNSELRKYVQALNIALEGEVNVAIEELEDLLSIYGDNVDVLNTLGRLAYYNVFRNNDNLFRCKKYYHKALEYDPDNRPIERSLLLLEIFSNNSIFIENLHKYYVENKIYDGNRLLIEIAHFNLKEIDSLYYERIFKLYENLSDSLNISLYQFLSATARPLGTIGRLDVFTRALDKNDHSNSLTFDELDQLDFFIQITKGKINEAFKKYPDKFHLMWRTWSAENMHEPDFQAINKERAKSILDNLPRNNDPNDLFYQYSKAFYGMIAGEEFEYSNGIKFFENKMKSKEDISLREEDFYFHRLKYNFHRTNGDPVTAQLYLDSLFSKARFDLRARGGLLWSPRFTEASILLEQGELEKAKVIFEKLEFWPWFLTYAPVKYKLAQVYDQMGENEKALKYYQHFYTIYKDCDPFYQHNVEHAKQRIEELEAQLIQPR